MWFNIERVCCDEFPALKNSYKKFQLITNLHVDGNIPNIKRLHTAQLIRSKRLLINTLFIIKTKCTFVMPVASTDFTT